MGLKFKKFYTSIVMIYDNDIWYDISCNER